MEVEEKWQESGTWDRKLLRAPWLGPEGSASKGRWVGEGMLTCMVWEALVSWRWEENGGCHGIAGSSSQFGLALKG